MTPKQAKLLIALDDCRNWVGTKKEMKAYVSKIIREATKGKK